MLQTLNALNPEPGSRTCCGFSGRLVYPFCKALLPRFSAADYDAMKCDASRTNAFYEARVSMAASQALVCSKLMSPRFDGSDVSEVKGVSDAYESPPRCVCGGSS